MKSLGTLAGGLAHDFNNLMMGIQGNVSLMLYETNPSDPHYQQLEAISQYVNNATGITSQLLGIAREGKYDAKPLNMNELLQKQIDLFSRTNKQVIVHTQFEQHIRSVEVDQSQMMQVLWNLFINASHAMSDGGDLFITTRNTGYKECLQEFPDAPEGDYIQLRIRDTGCGMDEDTLSQVFDPFFTTKEKERGTGLGLTSVYGVIQNHDGFIRMESVVGKGTEVTILLPASDKQAVSTNADKAGMVRGTGTVLLVDDEKFVRDITRDMLTMLGFEVISVGSGKEAISVYREQHAEIRLVILDLIMPGMGGQETYRNLKAINEQVVVLISSGYSADSEAENLLKQGCRGFIQKPFTMEFLSRELSRLQL